MTTQDRVREETWRSSIPIQVSIRAPETYDEYTYLLMARRNLFLPCYTPKIVAYFKRYLAIEDASDGEWWYSHGDMPLQWSRPVGVLYDTLAAGEPVWNIRIRHSGYPETILPISNDILTDYWRNQFKEACYARDGNANAIMNLARDKSHALFVAATDPSASHRDFWAIVDPLLRPQPLNIPIRIYEPLKTAPLRKSVRPFESDGEERSLGAVLNLLLPELFPSARSCSELVPLVHGVPIDLWAPIIELYKSTMCVDGFLHITLSTHTA